jgi:hypothetical protein
LTVAHSGIRAKDTLTAFGDRLDKRILEYYLKAEYSDFYGSFKFLSLTGGIDTHFDTRKELECELNGNIRSIESNFYIRRTEATTWRDSIIPFVDIGISVQFPVFDISTIYFNYAHRSQEVIEEAPGKKWYGVGAKLEPSSTVFFDIWAGKEKGGLVCSGGVCRWLFPFDGIKLKINISL